MNRTPMLPRKPALPSLGPITVAIAISFHWTSLSRENVADLRTICQYWSYSYVRSKAQVREEAPRRSRGADPPADHRKRRRAARHARPRPHLDERHRRARRRPPLDRLPALPRRAGAVRRLLGALGSDNPPPDIGGWAGSTDPDERLDAALAELYAYYRRDRGMLDKLLRDAPAVPIVDELMARLPRVPDEAAEVLMRGRGLRGNAADRTRAAIGHALAFRPGRT